MPPLTSENARALVGGAVPSKENDMIAQQKSQAPATLKVKVLRSFYFSGKVIPAQAEVELPRVFALEMHAANKVALVKEPEASAPAASKPEARGVKKGEGDAK